MDHLPIHQLDRGPIWDFIKIGMIIIMILYVVLVNIGNRVFNEYYNIINSFIRASTDEFLNRSKKITRIDLIFIIVLAVVLSFCFRPSYKCLEPVLENLRRRARTPTGTSTPPISSSAGSAVISNWSWISARHYPYHRSFRRELECCQHPKANGGCEPTGSKVPASAARRL